MPECLTETAKANHFSKLCILTIFALNSVYQGIQLPQKELWVLNPVWFRTSGTLGVSGEPVHVFTSFK